MKIDTQSILLELDERTGAILAVTSKRTGWKLLGDGAAALSWRLLIPLSERRRNHWVNGQEQTLTRCLQSDGATELFWSDLRSGEADLRGIEVVMRIAVCDGRLLLTMRIDNQSAYTVESVTAPYLCSLTPPENGTFLKGFLPNYNGASRWEISPRYQSFPGYYGLESPTQYAPWSGNLINPSTPFFLVETDGQGFYIGLHEPSTELVAFTTELYPGYRSGLDSLVPRGASIAGKAVEIRLSVVHMPYILGGEARTLPAMTLDFYEGDWEAGARLYQEDAASRIALAQVPSWAQEPCAWQQLQMNSPEDELRFRYVDLPDYARVCAANGVEVLQLVGWNLGGQDRGNPYHGTDPQLGTEQELREAIAQCRALGVKVVLFAKMIWADRGTAWYRDTLEAMAVRDPNGRIYAHPGFKYLTPTQLLDINPTRFAAMCFANEDYRRICKEQYLNMVSLGCDGILVDECLYHGAALLCFETAHGHRYGQPIYAFDCEMLREWKESTPDRELLFAGEGCYDQELAQYHMIYTRSFSKAHLPLTRFLFPKVPMMTSVVGFCDRNQINQCLLNRYQISYEPFCFKGRLTDFPDTVAYGSKMEAFRKSYAKWLWNGTFLGRDGYDLSSDAEEAEDVQYSVFSAEDGSRAMVLVNYSQEQTISVACPRGFSRRDSVDAPGAAALGPQAVLPPESALLLF